MKVDGMTLVLITVLMVFGVVGAFLIESRLTALEKRADTLDKQIASLSASQISLGKASMMTSDQVIELIGILSDLRRTQAGGPVPYGYTEVKE